MMKNADAKFLIFAVPMLVMFLLWVKGLSIKIVSYVLVILFFIGIIGAIIQIIFTKEQ